MKGLFIALGVVAFVSGISSTTSRADQTGQTFEIMNLTYSLSLKDAGFDANCEMVEIEVRQHESPAIKTEDLKR
ncbi:MAG: hypothetical protein WCS42_07900 [Verrucomicrobiota bacterium]